MTTIYPVPPAPFAYLPYIFILLVLAGLAWFIYLKAAARAQLEALEADLPEGDAELGGAK